MENQASLNRLQIDQLNQRCYDNRADYWDRFPFPEVLPDIIHAFAPDSPNRKVLDVGSGTGKLASWLKKQHYQVLCLDPSEEMVNRCRQKGLECLQTTIQEYQSQETFSIVLAILSLIHVPKQEMKAQLAKISSWLPSEGLFVLAMIEGKTESIEEKASGYPRFFAKYTDDEIKKLLNNDFDLIFFHRFSGPTTYLLFAFKKKLIPQSN